MFDFILGNTVFTKAIIACCFIGILSWSVLTISYRSMIRATSRIGQTKKKWLVSLKKKYEDYHEMDIKVWINISARKEFVDYLVAFGKHCIASQ